MRFRYGRRPTGRKGWSLELMSPLEIALIAALLLLIGGAVWVAYREPEETIFFNPLTILSAVFGYYFVVGPLIALSMGNTNAYRIEFRDSMWKAWLAGAVGLASIFCGFAIRTRRARVRLVEGADRKLRFILGRSFWVLVCLGLLGFGYDAYVSGRPLSDLLMPFHFGTASMSTERQGIAAGNYLFLLINTFIPAMCILTILTDGRPLLKRLVIVGLPTAQVVLYYITLGFRHRIVILVIAVVATAFLVRGKRPSPWMIVLGAAGLVLMAGVVGLTRSYGEGLDLGQIMGMSLSQIFLGGFSDSGTFFTTALIIDSVPRVFPFSGFNPFLVALTIPVPRGFWPSKPEPISNIYLAHLTGTTGQALPIVGEHYIAAGWIGIVVGGVIVGIIYRWFWDFYRSNPRNPMVIAIYAVSWALCFPVVNRGYLAQTLMEFFFDLMPLVALFWICRRSMRIRTGRREMDETDFPPDEFPEDTGAGPSSGEVANDGPSLSDSNSRS